MVPNPNNPLSKHFRQPAIYLKLPSGGAYWPESAIDLPVTGEIPVYPMTTKDEITLRTPDALLNGQGMVDVIHSCCPNIKNAWQMPSIDVDATLVAIRMASYGTDMEISSDCPQCKANSTHSIDLSYIMVRFKMPNFSDTLDIDGLKIKLKPQEYFAVNKNSQIMFEEQRILQAVSDDSVPEEVKTIKFNEHMKKLIELNLESLANSTDYIETPEGSRVTNKEHIKDFFDNTPTKTIKAMRERLDAIAAEAAIPNVQVQCEACDNTYSVGVEFNYTSFFDQGS